MHTTLVAWMVRELVYRALHRVQSLCVHLLYDSTGVETFNLLMLGETANIGDKNMQKDMRRQEFTKQNIFMVSSGFAYSLLVQICAAGGYDGKDILRTGAAPLHC